VSRMSAASTVMGNLLESNGLSDAEVDKYLGLLVSAYGGQADGEVNLRGEILAVMGQLCAQSVYKARAAGLFEPLFLDALGDEGEIVRQRALDGLKYIDKARALEVCRQKGLVN